MESINVSELVERLGSDEDPVRKMAVFKLQSNIGDPSFADIFILEGGLAKLRYLTMNASGNTLAYSLTSFSRLLEVDKGWEYVNQDLVERVRRPRGAISLPSSHPMTGRRACSHPSTRQHPTWRHVHTRLHCLPSLHNVRHDIPPRRFWFPRAQARHRHLSPISRNAR